MQRTITLTVVLVNLVIGAMNLFLPVPAMASSQGNEMKSSIDIGRIINFSESSTKLSKAAPPAGTIIAQAATRASSSSVVQRRPQTTGSFTAWSHLRKAGKAVFLLAV
ncbi:MAG: hypothetical protein ACLPN1_02760 [Dissulfurispiraceae bacterium]